MAIGERLRQLRRKARINQNEYAEMMKVKIATVGRYERGQREPSMEYLTNVCRHHSVSMDWLVTGHGDQQGEHLVGNLSMGGKISRSTIEQAAIDSLPEKPMEINPNQTYIFLPRVDFGTVIQPGSKVFDQVPFSQNWIRSRGLDHEKLVLGYCNTDSMFPTIAVGDLVLLDLRKEPWRDGIYVILDEATVLFRRVQKMIDSGMEISSDNQVYGRHEVPLNRISDLKSKIVGRIVWFGRSLC